MALPHLQVVITHDTQERDDGVQDGQTAKRRRHVARALLQDKVLQRTLVLLLRRGPAPPVPGILVVRVVASHLGDEDTLGQVNGERQRWGNTVGLLTAYFVEEEDEVDGEGDKQRQEAQVVEVSGQVVLSKQPMRKTD